MENDHRIFSTPTPIPTGLPWLDGYTGGIHDKSFWVHAAFSGELKTSFAVMVARYVADAGHRVAYVTLDQDADTIRSRVARMGTIPTGLDIFSYEGEVTVDDVRTGAMSARRAPSLIVLDSVALLRPVVGKHANWGTALNAMTRDLRRLADTAPTLALWQVNRSARTRADAVGGYTRVDEPFHPGLYEHADIITTAFVNRDGRRSVTFNCLQNTYGALMPPTTVGWNHETNDYVGLETGASF